MPGKKDRNKIVITDEDIELLVKAGVVPEFLDKARQQRLSDSDKELVRKAVEQTQLDPFPPAKQIYFLSRWNTELDRYLLIPCVGIDGMRLVSQRTGLYNGQEGPFYSGKASNYQWLEVWPYDKDELEFVKVCVYRKDVALPFCHSIKVSEFWGKGPIWDARPMHMIGLPSERQARRLAFPSELSGIYGEEELAVVDHLIAEEKLARDERKEDEKKRIAQSRQQVAQPEVKQPDTTTAPPQKVEPEPSKIPAELLINANGIQKQRSQFWSIVHKLGIKDRAVLYGMLGITSFEEIWSSKESLQQAVLKVAGQVSQAAPPEQAKEPGTIQRIFDDKEKR